MQNDSIKEYARILYDPIHPAHSLVEMSHDARSKPTHIYVVEFVRALDYLN